MCNIIVLLLDQTYEYHIGNCDDDSILVASQRIWSTRDYKGAESSASEARANLPPKISRKLATHWGP